MELCYTIILKCIRTSHYKDSAVFHANLILAFRQYELLQNIFFSYSAYLLEHTFKIDSAENSSGQSDY